MGTACLLSCCRASVHTLGAPQAVCVIDVQQQAQAVLDDHARRQQGLLLQGPLRGCWPILHSHKAWEQTP